MKFEKSISGQESATIDAPINVQSRKLTSDFDPRSRGKERNDSTSAISRKLTRYTCGWTMKRTQ